MCIKQLQKVTVKVTDQLQLQLQCNREHIGFPSVALEIKLQMEHCMPVIHRVRVDFNILGHPIPNED